MDPPSLFSLPSENSGPSEKPAFPAASSVQHEAPREPVLPLALGALGERQGLPGNPGAGRPRPWGLCFYQGVRDLRFVTTFLDLKGLLGALNQGIWKVYLSPACLLDRAQLCGLICGILECYQTGGQAPYHQLSFNPLPGILHTLVM